jgi:SAM-dependent methyltransferase
MRITDDLRGRSKLADLGRWYITRFVEDVARGLAPGTRVLDAGAGECFYKTLFAHCRYFAIDLATGDSLWNYGNVDSVARLDRIPLRESSIDAILCTQVLEHLEWPRESARELHRVLRPGGMLFLTAPMAHLEHQVPHDYFRYTSYGLRSILGEAGFTLIRIQPFGGILTRLAYELPRIMGMFPGSGLGSARPSISGILLLPVRAVVFALIRSLQVVFLWAERFDREKSDPFGWSVTARR